MDGVSVCSNCGAFVNTAPAKSSSGLVIAAKIFMIWGTIVQGLLIIPLAWCIPMTISYFNAVKYNRPVSTAFKICTFLFVSWIAAVFMLCDQEH